jgi:hypothetical protein
MYRKSVFLNLLVLTAVPVANVSAGPGPVGWWNFDEGSGATAGDSSGNNYDGTINETVSWIPGCVGPHALRFASGCVRVSDRSQLRPSRFTVCAWVNLPAPQADYARLLVKGNDNFESYNFQFNGYSLHFLSQDTGSRTRREFSYTALA